MDISGSEMVNAVKVSVLKRVMNSRLTICLFVLFSSTQANIMVYTVVKDAKVSLRERYAKT